MDSVVVAGATGYLGRHIVAELKARGYDVRAVVRSRRRTHWLTACRPADP